MIVIVTGSRDWTNSKVIFDALDACHATTPIEVLVNGGARGADDISTEWAIHNKVECVIVPAEWDLYGKAAGMRRNRKMLDMYPKAHVLGFPLGRSPGTRGCLAEAKKRGMPYRVTEG